MKYVYGLEDMFKTIQRCVNNPSVTQAIQKLVAENAEMSKQIEEHRKERIQSLVESLESSLTGGERDGVVGSSGRFLARYD